jgi:hypothetical protein
MPPPAGVGRLDYLGGLIGWGISHLLDEQGVDLLRRMDDDGWGEGALVCCNVAEGQILLLACPALSPMDSGA